MGRRVWRGVAWRGVAWRGVVWRGVAWRGVAWRCVVVWRGVVVKECHLHIQARTRTLTPHQCRPHNLSPFRVHGPDPHKIVNQRVSWNSGAKPSIVTSWFEELREPCRGTSSPFRMRYHDQRQKQTQEHKRDEHHANHHQPHERKHHERQDHHNTTESLESRREPAPGSRGAKTGVGGVPFTAALTSWTAKSAGQILLILVQPPSGMNRRQRPLVEKNPQEQQDTIPIVVQSATAAVDSPQSALVLSLLPSLLLHYLRPLSPSGGGDLDKPPSREERGSETMSSNLARFSSISCAFELLLKLPHLLLLPLGLQRLGREEPERGGVDDLAGCSGQRQKRKPGAPAAVHRGAATQPCAPQARRGAHQLSSMSSVLMGLCATRLASHHSCGVRPLRVPLRRSDVHAEASNAAVGNDWSTHPDPCGLGGARGWGGTVCVLVGGGKSWSGLRVSCCHQGPSICPLCFLKPPHSLQDTVSTRGKLAL